ncbi:MAG: response regulator transcription factor [Chloroflexi bacterium]|nr:response regulator transcription factor [Chloroflexota bacterium]
MEVYPVTNPTVLLIDDDKYERDVVQWELSREGFNVIYAENGIEGLRQLYEQHPDLVLLDINMPQMDGYTVCQRIREVSSVPIIIVSALETPESIVRSLDLGADDYVVKPYKVDVLVARARATLRRAAAEPTVGREQQVYNDGYLTINLEERRVLVDGELMRLSPTEYRLLELLLQESPRVVPYRVLLENVWGFEYINDIDYLRVYIWHLRNKLEPNPREPIYILNELGVGYRFQRHI